MAFSDLCHISNAYKTVENESDQSERIMEENLMVRDLITKILDETSPAEGSSPIQSPEKTVSLSSSTQFPQNDSGRTSFIPPSNYNMYQDPAYSFNQNEQNFNYNLQNSFGNTNGFVNYADDGSFNLDLDTTDTVTPEQLNLLRLAAQEIGGAQFTSPNNEKFYNFLEPNQRNSLPEGNMFSTNFRPNSLNLDMNFNSFENPYNVQRFNNKYDNTFMKENQDSTDILSYLNQLNMSERPREDNLIQNNMDFKMPMEMNGHYPNEEYKLQEDRNKMFYNRNYQQMPQKGYQNGENNYFINEMVKQMNDRSPINQNYDFSQTSPVPGANAMTYKPNGYPQNDFMQRRDAQVLPRENYVGNGNFDISGVGNNGNMQQAVIRQNQELARQMGLLMRNRPPPNQLNVDVSFLHDNAPFNLGIGALLGPSPPVQPPVLPSPILDLPLLAPFYAMRNMRSAATSSGILHARLDACYEQWRQLERERKRTEAKLALAFPGRAVSSSNSIPVPRLPPCPTRVDRLTVDMLREHTKVLTLMGKMETLRASVCVAQNKKHNKQEEKITVLKRGQENVEKEADPDSFDPKTWKEDILNLAEIAPHSEVEAAMLAWRGAVAHVQAARRRELAPTRPPPHPQPPQPRHDPILQLAEAVKQLGLCARRARCAMWCDLTLTVALAPTHTHTHTPDTTPTHMAHLDNGNDKVLGQSATSSKQNQESSASLIVKQTNENKEEKSSNASSDTSAKSDTKMEKSKDKNHQRKTQNYRKINQGRNDFYQKNQRYDNRFMHRSPYHYLATGPIN